MSDFKKDERMNDIHRKQTDVKCCYCFRRIINLHIRNFDIFLMNQPACMGASAALGLAIFADERNESI